MPRPAPRLCGPFRPCTRSRVGLADALKPVDLGLPVVLLEPLELEHAAGVLRDGFVNRRRQMPLVVGFAFEVRAAGAALDSRTRPHLALDGDLVVEPA